MRISVFYDHIRQAHEQTAIPVSQLLCQAVDLGITGIELNYSQAVSNDALELITAAGLSVSCLWEFYDMPSADETAHIDRHVRLAKELGSKMLVVPGFLDDAQSRSMAPLVHHFEALADFLGQTEAAVRMRDGLRYASEEGRVKGVAVTIEDFDDRKSTISNINGLRWDLENVPELALIFDMGNFITFGEDVLSAYDQLHARIVHVHCKERGFGGEFGDCRQWGDSVGADSGTPSTEWIRWCARHRAFRRRGPARIDAAQRTFPAGGLEWGMSCMMGTTRLEHDKETWRTRPFRLEVAEGISRAGCRSAR